MFYTEPEISVKILVKELDYLQKKAIPLFEKLLKEAREKTQQIESKIQETGVILKKPH